MAIFTGVAGSAKKFINQWDVIISESSLQHDMDARPLFDKYEIPAIKKKLINSDKSICEKIYQILLNEKEKKGLKKFGKIYKGLIATGDQFISDQKAINIICEAFPEVLAVEMEGSSFAQVAYQERVNWMIIRTISDSADNSADEEFSTFIKEYETHSWGLIESILSSINIHTMNS